MPRKFTKNIHSPEYSMSCPPSPERCELRRQPTQKGSWSAIRPTEIDTEFYEEHWNLLNGIWDRVAIFSRSQRYPEASSEETCSNCGGIKITDDAAERYGPSMSQDPRITKVEETYESEEEAIRKSLQDQEIMNEEAKEEAKEYRILVKALEKQEALLKSFEMEKAEQQELREQGNMIRDLRTRLSVLER